MLTDNQIKKLKTEINPTVALNVLLDELRHCEYMCKHYAELNKKRTFEKRTFEKRTFEKRTFEKRTR